ncbi:MAG TPA: hypothetical protein EYG03_21240 [Planctomycetes bacterium]|nr:hypothetical protein [Fuerstiella sp.]HIK94478.1 hypothetical protein [Planctomycetota bacterium]
MTFQKTVLLGFALLLGGSTASAQYCARARAHTVYAHPSYHYLHHLTYPISQTSYSSPHHPQTVELPPNPAGISFGEFSHVDVLAARLEVLMNELCLDLYYNYSQNPDFHATYSEAYALYQTTRYIHAAEHNYDRETVRQRLGGADALFHHIQDDVRGWRRVSRRQIGTLGIATKLEMAEQTLHHLMEDVGVAVTPGLEEPPTPTSLPVVPPPPATIE